MRKKQRVGVYICHCGRNIAGYVDIPKLVEGLNTVRDVAMVKDEKYLCSDQGQATIKEDLKEGLIDRVIVASCSPIMHERTFRRCVAEEGVQPLSLSTGGYQGELLVGHQGHGRGDRKSL